MTKKLLNESLIKIKQTEKNNTELSENFILEKSKNIILLDN